VGELVQNAVSVRLLPTAGELLLTWIWHTGRLPTGGGGGCVTPLRQSTVTPTFELSPALLLARSA
jgi:hypothetical protein